MNGENQLIPKPIRCVSGAYTLTFLFDYLVSIFSANKMDWIVFLFFCLVREFFLFRLALYSHSIVPGIGKGDGEVNVQGKCFPFFFPFSSCADTDFDGETLSLHPSAFMRFRKRPAKFQNPPFYSPPC